MGNYGQHKILGTIFWAATILAYYLAVQDNLNTLPNIVATIVLFIVSYQLATLSAVFPDIDLRKARIRKQTRHFMSKFMAISAFSYYTLTKLEPTNLDWAINATIVGILVYAITYVLINQLPMRHRGNTHTIRFALLLAIIVFVTANLLFTIAEPTMLQIGITIPIIFFPIFFGLQVIVGYVSHLILDNHIKM